MAAAPPAPAGRAYQRPGVIVETMLVWPNTTSAGVPVGTFSFYTVRFVGETKAVVVAPLMDLTDAANFKESARNAGWPVN